MYFPATEKALCTFTFPSKFRGYAALNAATNIKCSKKGKAENVYYIKYACN